MIGCCSFCPCFGISGDADDDLGRSNLDPVLLISGIGGSILHSKRRRRGFQTRVWVRIFLADLEFQEEALVYLQSENRSPLSSCVSCLVDEKMREKVRKMEYRISCFCYFYIWFGGERMRRFNSAMRSYTEALDDDSEILVPDDDHGLYAIDILDPSVLTKCLHLKEVYYFHDMINMLLRCGYKKGITLFGYGYDFRQSNRIDKAMEGLKIKLQTAYKASGGRKVFSKYVNKWICIGCPFQGAPGCINGSLLTGLQFVDGLESFFFVLRWTMHQLLVESPSIYEMMANPEFQWKKQPEIQVWRKQFKDKKTSSVVLETYGPTESITLFEEALRDNEVSYDGRTIAVPFNFSILQWATGTRQVLNNAQLPTGVSFYNIYGTCFDTPFDVCYGSETSPINDLSDLCHTIPEYSYVDGDETVPAESAKADGFAAIARVGVAARHRDLLRDKKIFLLKLTGTGDPFT
uniref:Phospholipase A(1) LCAT3 n=1 Tax=Vitis vinifera TaxID=29760 RepID=A5BRJ7_VITVI|nr:hypothetical protein VITISV_008632 [Vitis vinifera]